MLKPLNNTAFLSCEKNSVLLYFRIRRVTAVIAREKLHYLNSKFKCSRYNFLQRVVLKSTPTRKRFFFIS